MKKIIFGITLMFAGLMVSCGGHKTETTTEDTVVTEEVVTDSVACDSVEAVPCDTVVAEAE